MSLINEMIVGSIPTSFEKFTGARPSVKVTNQKTIYYWQGNELVKMRAWLADQMKAKPYDPNGLNVDFDWMPVVQPIITPYGIGALALLAGMFILGRLSK